MDTGASDHFQYPELERRVDIQKGKISKDSGVARVISASCARRVSST